MGCILFLVEEGEQRLAGITNLLVGDRAGVKRLGGIQEMDRLLARTFTIAERAP